MGRYTVLQDPGADAAVQSVLDRVCGQVADLLGNRLRAIVLVGGYGRGEGGVYRRNGQYHLVNDLDLLVFVSGSLRRAEARFASELEQLSHQLLEDGKGLKEIDLDLTEVRRFRLFVPNTVGNYEIAMGQQVVYGDLDLRKLMPELDPRSLPMYEGTNYFRNRGSGLLIPAVYFLTDGLKNPEKRKNFQIELQKACQAMGDACLLMTGQYHFSYRERLQRFQQFGNDALGVPADLYERVAPFYEWGVTGKLTPRFEWPGDEEMVNRWFEVRDVLGDFFLWYESARLHGDFAAWGEYSSYVANEGADEPLDLRFRSILASVLSFLWGRGAKERARMSPIQRNRWCLSIMPLLLSSLTPDVQIKPLLVARASELMGQPVPAPDLAAWQQLVKEYLLTLYPHAVVMDAVDPLPVDSSRRV